MKVFFLTLVAGWLLLQHYGYCETETNELDQDPTEASKMDNSRMGSREARDALRKQLFDEYDKGNNPDNVKLDLGMYLIKFDVDEKKETFEATAWLQYMWNDDRLTWDAEKTGINMIRNAHQDLWKPDLTLYNSIDPRNMLPCGDTNVIMYPNGKILWVPPCKFSAFCNLTYTQTPDGPQQSCYLKFGSWTFDGNTLELGLMKNETQANVDDQWENNKYILTENKATWENKYYACCKEPYPNIQYSFSFRKKAEFCT